MSWNTGHCGHINCVFINVLNISWRVSTYFWTIFTHMLSSLEFKAGVEEKERTVTFGLNTAVSVFMAHQQGVMRRWEGVRPNYSSLTQHSEGMTSEKKAAGAREEQKTRHNDGREIKWAERQEQEKATQAEKERETEWYKQIDRERPTDRRRKIMETEDHFEESHSLWSA